MPYKLATERDRQLVQFLIPVALQMRQLDKYKENMEITRAEEQLVREKELRLANEAIEVYGLHSDQILDFLLNENPKPTLSQFLNEIGQSVKILSDLYFRSGYLKLTSDIPVDSTGTLYKKLFPSQD